MINAILDLMVWLEKLLWGPWTLVFIALVSVYFTVRSGFFQFRHFPFIMKSTFGNMFTKGKFGDKRRISPFQAATTSLGGTVGMGNIAGVAIGLTIGGPGAVFWMWLLALLGMVLKTAEITLGVHYREVDKDGNYYGGPMYYIRKGLGWKPLAIIFSFAMILDAVLAATLLQPHTVGRTFLSSYKINPYLVAAAMSIITGLVVIGGARRVGKFCERLVPFMSLIYIMGGLVIIALNYHEIPAVLVMIFRHAFSPAPAVGGFAGAAFAAAVKEGVSKGMFSNEAGQGSAPMAHATAVTEHPFQQGVWGAFEVFIDTIIICTISALIILLTGQLSSGQQGIDLIIGSFSAVFPEVIASAIVSFSILTFCLSTQIGFFVYYETAVVDVFGVKAMKLFKWFYLLPGIIFAGVSNVTKIWTITYVTVGCLAIPNLLAMLALGHVFFKLKNDYMRGINKYSTEKIDQSCEYIRSA